jgi:hypothetical protein
MSTTLDGLCLSHDFEEAATAPDAARWRQELGGNLEVLVTMSPTKQPEETFQARLRWTSYPAKPPSLKFSHPGKDDITDPTAWPVCPGFRPASQDSCVHWTAEGHLLHPEWAGAKATRWDATGNPLLRVLHCLQDTLDITFSGRYGK